MVSETLMGKGLDVNSSKFTQKLFGNRYLLYT